MTDHDHLFDEPTATRGAIRLDLEGLARTMPDDPDRVGRVLAGAARHRRRHQAGRAVAGATLVAATVGGLVVVRMHAPSRGTSAVGATPDSTAATTVAAKPADGQAAVSCSMRVGPNGAIISSGVIAAGGLPAPAGVVDANGPAKVPVQQVTGAAGGLSASLPVRLLVPSGASRPTASAS